MNLRTHRATLPVLAIALFAAGLLSGAFLFRPQPAQAQVAEKIAEAVVVDYALSAFDPGAHRLESRASDFQDLWVVPNMPVFLVRNEVAVTIAQVTDKGIRKLAEIPNMKNFKSLTFLDDGRTFIIRNDRFVRVYAIDKNMQVTGKTPASRLR